MRQKNEALKSFEDVREARASMSIASSEQRRCHGLGV
jgi:hypothetical protein